MYIISLAKVFEYFRIVSLGRIIGLLNSKIHMVNSLPHLCDNVHTIITLMHFSHKPEMHKLTLWNIVVFRTNSKTYWRATHISWMYYILLESIRQTLHMYASENCLQIGLKLKSIQYGAGAHQIYMMNSSLFCNKYTRRCERWNGLKGINIYIYLYIYNCGDVLHLFIHIKAVAYTDP